MAPTKNQGVTKKKSRLERELESTLPSGAKDAVVQNIGPKVGAAKMMAPENSRIMSISAEIEGQILDLLCD